MCWDIKKVLKWTGDYFKKNEIDSPRTTAEILLAHVLGKKRIDLYINHDLPLSETERTEFKKLIKRRILNEPVSYITGKKEFWSIEFNITDAVLIPRPDTECLVENILSHLSKADFCGVNRVLEIGTGSGAIIVSLAKEKGKNRYFALDCSVDALMVACSNAKKNRVSDRIVFFASDLFSGVYQQNTFDIIVSNPPYIPTASINNLQQEIKGYEPVIALDGKKDGLYFIREIINSAYKFLKPCGILAMEIGFDQKEQVVQIVHEADCYENISFCKDFGGNYRVVQMYRRR